MPKEHIMNILPFMIAPYQIVCACGRTIPRQWPPNDREARCDYCADAAKLRLAQAEFMLIFPQDGTDRLNDLDVKP